MQTELIFERALNGFLWHFVSEEEVRQIFNCFDGFDRLLKGDEVLSPFGTNVIYRCANPPNIAEDLRAEIAGLNWELES